MYSAKRLSNMKLECVVPPAKEPVTVAEVNEFLRIDDDIEDNLVASFISAARMFCEEYQHQAYNTQTLRLVINTTECGSEVELPRSMYLQKITKVASRLPDGTETAVLYSTGTGGILTVVKIADVLPAEGVVIIEYITGNDDLQLDNVKMAIKLLVSGWHNNRLPYNDSSRMSEEVPYGVKALLNPGRIML